MGGKAESMLLTQFFPVAKCCSWWRWQWTLSEQVSFWSRTSPHVTNHLLPFYLIFQNLSRLESWSSEINYKVEWRWWQALLVSRPRCWWGCSSFFSSPSVSGTTFPFLKYNFGGTMWREKWFVTWAMRGYFPWLHERTETESWGESEARSLHCQHRWESLLWIRTDQCDPKSCCWRLERRAVTGDGQSGSGMRRCRKEDVRTEEMF